MPYEAFGIQAGNALQTAFSDLLMGMREGRAMREQSLREKAYEQEKLRNELEVQAYQQQNEVRGMQLLAAKQTMDLERATALGAASAQAQFDKLNNLAVNDDFEGLRSSNYIDVNVEGATPEAVLKFNNMQREAFRVQKANALSASAGQKNRLQDISHLTDYSLSLADDPIKRGIADETRFQLQQGIPISRLTPEQAEALTSAAKLAAQKALMSNPTYQGKMLDVAVKQAELRQQNLKEDNKSLDDQVKVLETQWVEAQKAVGQAAQSGNQKLVEQLQQVADGHKSKWLEASAKRNQAQRGAVSNKDALWMMESSILPQDGEATYIVEYTLPGETQVRTREMTFSQYGEAMVQNGRLLNLRNFTLKKTGGK